MSFLGTGALAATSAAAKKLKNKTSKPKSNLGTKGAGILGSALATAKPKAEPQPVRPGRNTGTPRKRRPLGKVISAVAKRRRKRKGSKPGLKKTITTSGTAAMGAGSMGY